MKKIDANKKILLDADVIIHFCKADCIGTLPQIYTNKYFVPDVVYKEALSKRFQTEINNLVHFKMVEELEITSSKDVAKEYLFLTQTKKLGKGESA